MKCNLLATILIILVAAGHVDASFVSVNPGNDDAAYVSSLLGEPVTLAGKYDDVGFSHSPTYTESGVASDNTLMFTSPSTGYLLPGVGFHVFAVKAGDDFGLYEFDAPVTPWVSPNGKDVSHVTLYHLPEPASVLLFGLGALTLLTIGRRR